MAELLDHIDPTATITPRAVFNNLIDIVNVLAATLDMTNERLTLVEELVEGLLDLEAEP